MTYTKIYLNTIHYKSYILIPSDFKYACVCILWLIKSNGGVYKVKYPNTWSLYMCWRGIWGSGGEVFEPSIDWHNSVEVQHAPENGIDKTMESLNYCTGDGRNLELYCTLWILWSLLFNRKDTIENSIFKWFWNYWLSNYIIYMLFKIITF